MITSRQSEAMQSRLNTHNYECQHKLRAAEPKQIYVTGNEVLWKNLRQNITYSEFFMVNLSSTSFNLAKGFCFLVFSP